MIGEVRDSVAAEMAVRCALTGHLVVTSIHSSSCINAINRLIELGVSSLQLQDILSGMSNQRLYDTEGGKIGVYEIMDRREIEYYFTNHRNSSSFRSLESQIKEAVSEGMVEAAQASQDIAG